MVSSGFCVRGRSRHDLSGSILSPIIRVNERPHRALAWKDVKRILRAVDRSRPTGRRDYAILLMMSVYGLGSGEVIGLSLDDINWRAQTLVWFVRRRALSFYCRCCRRSLERS